MVTELQLCKPVFVLKVLYPKTLFQFNKFIVHQLRLLDKSAVLSESEERGYRCLFETVTGY